MTVDALNDQSTQVSDAVLCDVSKALGRGELTALVLPSLPVPVADLLGSAEVDDGLLVDVVVGHCWLSRV